MFSITSPKLFKNKIKTDMIKIKTKFMEIQITTHPSIKNN